MKHKLLLEMTSTLDDLEKSLKSYADTEVLTDEMLEFIDSIPTARKELTHAIKRSLFGEPLVVKFESSSAKVLESIRLSDAERQEAMLERVSDKWRHYVDTRPGHHNWLCWPVD